MIFCMLVEDFTFNIGHRLLHRPFFYKHIHKVHHSHIVTISMAAHYAHPLEFLFGNVIPVAIPTLILGERMHMFTVFAWGFMRNCETMDGHSGYEFPWSPYQLLPFQPGYSYHAYHHSQNIGNFSSFFTIWDTVLGTNKHYY
jgi:sterol desaturase/sphingolipid hydroxylase (fatty acid hydroxylase superfamily)